MVVAYSPQKMTLSITLSTVLLVVCSELLCSLQLHLDLFTATVPSEGELRPAVSPSVSFSFIVHLNEQNQQFI